MMQRARVVLTRQAAVNKRVLVRPFHTSFTQRHEASVMAPDVLNELKRKVHEQARSGDLTCIDVLPQIYRNDTFSANNTGGPNDNVLYIQDVLSALLSSHKQLSFADQMKAFHVANTLNVLKNENLLRRFMFSLTNAPSTQEFEHAVNTMIDSSRILFKNNGGTIDPMRVIPPVIHILILARSQHNANYLHQVFSKSLKVPLTETYYQNFITIAKKVGCLDLVEKLLADAQSNGFLLNAQI